jgi:predicted porin
MLSLRSLSIAVLTAWSLSAQAQTESPVLGPQIYGKLNVGIDRYRATGAAGALCNGAPCDLRGRARQYDIGSVIGLRGAEDLDGGRTFAVWQLETGVNIDSGSRTGQNGIVNQNTGLLASRDSFVGIRSADYGQVTFGRQSMYWFNGGINDVGSNLVNVASPMATANFSGVVIGPAARESNSMQYSFKLDVAGRPLFGQLSYALPDTAQTPSESVQAGQYARERVLAASFRWGYAFDARALPGYPRWASANPRGIEVAVDWATRYNTNQVPGRDATGIKAGLAWRYAGDDGQVGVIAQWLRNAKTFGTGVLNAVTATPPFAGCPGGVTAQQALPAALSAAVAGGGATCAGDTLRQSMVTLSWDQRVAPRYRVVAEYSHAGNVKGSTAAAGLPDSGARAWTLGMRYEFGPRAAAYLAYAQIRNGRNNYMDYWGGWATSGQTLNAYPGIGPNSAGADPRIIALGFRYYL